MMNDDQIRAVTTAAEDVQRATKGLEEAKKRLAIACAAINTAPVGVLAPILSQAQAQAMYASAYSGAQDHAMCASTYASGQSNRIIR